MKQLLFAVILFPSLLCAQSQPPVAVRLPVPVPSSRGAQASADVLADNYQVTLVITDKDGQPVEISIVTASSPFTASIGEQDLNFGGTLSVEDSGNLMVTYSLGWQTPTAINGNIQFKSSTTQGSAHLKAGEEIQILRAGTRTARLSIKKLETVQAK